tara:strand:- start:412 stop:630 length:219 start_codon:yes stop_codon:yes gene_type:complete
MPTLTDSPAALVSTPSPDPDEEVSVDCDEHPVAKGKIARRNKKDINFRMVPTFLSNERKACDQKQLTNSVNR